MLHGMRSTKRQAMDVRMLAHMRTTSARVLLLGAHRCTSCLRGRGHRAIAFCRRSRLAGASVAKPGERGTFVEGDVLGLAALDLVLRRLRARMVGVAFDFEVARVLANDRAADAPGL